MFTEKQKLKTRTKSDEKRIQYKFTFNPFGIRKVECIISATKNSTKTTPQIAYYLHTQKKNYMLHCATKNYDMLATKCSLSVLHGIWAADSKSEVGFALSRQN